MSDQAEIACAIPSQPADSRCTVTQQADGVTITVPARGFFAGSNGMGLWSVIWCALMAQMTIFIILMTLLSIYRPDKVHGAGPTPLAALLCLAFFWTPGLLVLRLALRRGRTDVVIDVAGVSTDPGADAATPLLITERFPWRIRQRRWSCARLTSISVGPTWLGRGNRNLTKPLPEMQIEVAHGLKIVLFTGRNVNELAWLAAVLRQATGASDGGIPVWAWFLDSTTLEPVKQAVPPEEWARASSAQA